MCANNFFAPSIDMVIEYAKRGGGKDMPRTIPLIFLLLLALKVEPINSAKVLCLGIC